MNTIYLVCNQSHKTRKLECCSDDILLPSACFESTHWKVVWDRNDLAMPNVQTMPLSQKLALPVMLRNCPLAKLSYDIWNYQWLVSLLQLLVCYYLNTNQALTFPSRVTYSWFHKIVPTCFLIQLVTDDTSSYVLQCSNSRIVIRGTLRPPNTSANYDRHLKSNYLLKL